MRQERFNRASAHTLASGDLPGPIASPAPTAEPLERTLQALDVPPPDPPLAIRVDHFVVPRDGKLLDVLTELLGYPKPFVERLIWFGSVWYSHVLPQPREKKTLTQEQLQHFEEMRKPAIQKWGNRSQAQVPRRIQSPDFPVYEGGYIRAHVHPKRFAAVHKVPDWRSRVLAVTDDYVVVDKPAGVQVPPTVGNAQESVLTCVEKALGFEPGSLNPPHRLDAGTQGCVILSRNATFARYFQELLKDKGSGTQSPTSPRSEASGPAASKNSVAPSSQQDFGHSGDGAATKQSGPQQPSMPAQPGGSLTPEHHYYHSHQHLLQQQQQQQQPSAELDASLFEPTSRVRKTYRCITAQPPQLGIMQHWMLLGVREVGGMAHTAPVPEGQPIPPDAKWCALQVLQVEKVRLSQEAAECWKVDPGATAYQSTIRLITGRTHQIRAQFAACGLPLLGDNLYEALAERWKSSSSKHNGGEGVSGRGKESDSSWCRAAQRDPSQPVGLQAWEMEILEDGPYFGPAPCRFRAGPPWWWAGTESGH